MKNIKNKYFELRQSLSSLLLGNAPTTSIISFILSLPSVAIGVLTVFNANLYKYHFNLVVGVLIIICGSALLYSSLTVLKTKIKNAIQAGTAGTIFYSIVQLSADIVAKEIAWVAAVLFSLLWIWLWRLEKHE